MKLQFFHVHDLCRFIDVLLSVKPQQHVFNVGNKEAVSVREWVELCYRTAGKQAEFISIYEDVEQRNYFSFYDYEYYLDVSAQYELLETVKPLAEGLKEAFEWYSANSGEVNKRPYIEYIDNTLV